MEPSSLGEKWLLEAPQSLTPWLSGHVLTPPDVPCRTFVQSPAQGQCRPHLVLLDVASIPKVITWYKMVAVAPAIMSAFQASWRRKGKDKSTVPLFRDLSGKLHIPPPLTFSRPQLSLTAMWSQEWLGNAVFLRGQKVMIHDPHYMPSENCSGSKS